MADEAVGGSTPSEGSAPQAGAGAIDGLEGSRADKGAKLEEGGQEGREPVKIKPIPPPKKGTGSLPGVHARGADDFVAGLDRDERGRFAKKAESAPFEDSDPGESEAPVKAAKEGDKPAEAAKPPAAPGTPNPDAPVKFLGKEYKGGLSEVEQVHRSLQGQFRTLSEEKRSLTEERNYGYQQANGWKAHADRLQAENEALKARLGGGVQAGQVDGRSSAKQPSTGAPSVDDILNEIDTDTFETTAAEGGLPLAGKYLVGETLKVVLEKIIPHVRNELKSEFDSRIKPFEDTHQEAQMQSGVDQVIDSVKRLQTHDGGLAFPELADGNTLQEIGEIWRDAGLPPEHALTAKGLISAVALYRLYKGLPDPGAASTTPQPAVPTPTPGREAVAAPAPGSAASLADSRSTGRPPSNGRSNLDPRLREMLSGFNEGDLVAETNLGFQRRRRPSNFSE